MQNWPIVDIVAVSMLKGVTAADVMRLVESTSDLEGALLALGAGDGLFDAPCAALRDIAFDAIRRAERMNVKLLTWQDAAMPRRMRSISWPPALLWVRGELPAEECPTIAVVGTRSCTMQYGVPVTQNFVAAWVDAGCAIVSGLANGIDTVAHETAIKHGGLTIAVIASGIDRISPHHAKRLADSIVEHGGCIVSEYRCGLAALPPFFPQRNRIISALSDAVVVVESDRKGGSLITANFARLHGRKLYSVPGPVTSSRSAGTNELLRNNTAQAVCTPSHVLDDLGIHSLTPQSAQAQLSALDVAILAAIEGGEVYVDDVALRCSLEVGDLWAALLDMELRCLVRQVPGGRVAAMIRV